MKKIVKDWFNESASRNNADTLINRDCIFLFQSPHQIKPWHFGFLQINLQTDILSINMVEATSYTNKVKKTKSLKGKKKPNSRQIQHQDTPPLTAIEFGGDSPHLDMPSRAHQLSQDIMIFAFPVSGQPICLRLKKI